MNLPVFQSIATRDLPATNTKPGRIKATSTSGISITWSIHTQALDHCSRSDDRHMVVAKALAARLEWGTDLIQGSTKEGFVFVLLPKEYSEAIGALEFVAGVNGEGEPETLETECSADDGKSRGIKLAASIRAARFVLTPFADSKEG